MYLFDKRAGSGTSAGYAALIDGNSTNYLGYIADGSNAATVSNTTDYHDGLWHHFAFSFDGTSVISSYIDGVLVGTNTQALGSTANANALIIGAHRDGSTSPFDGNICQMGIWNAALTQAQIQSVMEKTFEEFTASEKTNLVSYWALDETTLGSDLVDTKTTDSSYWSAFGGNSIAVVDGSTIEITYVNDASGFYSQFRDSKGLTTDLTIGAGYQISFDAKYTGGPAGSKVVIVGSSTTSTSNLTTSYVSYEISFTSSSETTNNIKFSGLGVEDEVPNVVSIKNIVLKAVQVEDLKGSNNGTLI
jgi:hypothetical protein